MELVRESGNLFQPSNVQSDGIVVGLENRRPPAINLIVVDRNDPALPP
jgi:hypothetical protein